MNIRIETYGCQMNAYDSELIATILAEAGHRMGAEVEEADAVLINTCAVREHAEQRVLGRLGQLSGLKKVHGRPLLGVCGCMAERLGTGIFERAPYVDLLAGPDSYLQLPALLEAAAHGDEQQSELDLDERQLYTQIHSSQISPPHAWIAVMRGCNNFCAYCIVPYVRGRERSRPLDDVLAEARRAVAKGAREITVLGQNITSYRSGDAGLGELFRALDRIDGLHRIRFATSHPRDMARGMLEAMAECEKVCEYLHLPVQAGSDRVLRQMNRGYTIGRYLETIGVARELMPDLSLATDIIVGFPGETERDFEQTLEVVREVRFDAIFNFKYSPRAGTRAAKMDDNVPPEEKQERLTRLMALQKPLALERNESFIGRTEELLVHGPNPRRPDEMAGRTRTNKLVYFPGSQGLVGQLVQAEIERAGPNSLFGRLAAQHS